jgi:hypothetical protein
MADIDLLNSGYLTITHTCTNTSTGSLGTITENVGSGTSQYSYDENDSTYQGMSKSGPDNMEGCVIVSQHDFTPARTITSIKYHTSGNTAGSSQYYQAYQGIWNIEYKVGSTWYSVASYDSGLGGNVNWNTGLVTYTPGSPIANVIGIRATSTIICSMGDQGGTLYARIYEIQAFGQPCDDIGLRFYDDNTVKKIGVQTLGTHKLRVRKGTTTYGIPLAATTDSKASTVRIYHGSLVRALPLVD